MIGDEIAAIMMVFFSEMMVECIQVGISLADFFDFLEFG